MSNLSPKKKIGSPRDKEYMLNNYGVDKDSINKRERRFTNSNHRI
jgi:hypothetical protein